MHRSTIPSNTSDTHGHPLKLNVPNSRINVRAHAFPVRVISLWNRLLAKIVFFNSMIVLLPLYELHTDFYLCYTMLLGRPHVSGNLLACCAN